MTPGWPPQPPPIRMMTRTIIIQVPVIIAIIGILTTQIIILKDNNDSLSLKEGGQGGSLEVA